MELWKLNFFNPNKCFKVVKINLNIKFFSSRFMEFSVPSFVSGFMEFYVPSFVSGKYPVKTNYGFVTLADVRNCYILNGQFGNDLLSGYELLKYFIDQPFIRVRYLRS